MDALSDEELNKLQKQYVKGCGKIYHQPGYMNAKGDAAYDFTCDGSHRCPKCESHFRRYSNLVWARNVNKLLIEGRKIKVIEAKAN